MKRFARYNVRGFFLAVTMFVALPKMSAQTDMTSYISNAGFESGTSDWTINNLVLQDNNGFTLKSGKKFLENWHYSDPVGNAGAYQAITNLPAGHYELTAEAQNVLQSASGKAQTGVWIYANDEQTVVTSPNTYKVLFTHVSGRVTIGLKAENATGNWVACDNFRLRQLDDARDLVREYVQAEFDAVRSRYGDASGNGAEALKQAIEQTEIVLADVNADSKMMTEQLARLQQAVENYQISNASEESPYDITSWIVNPSFEDGLSGWTCKDMKTQSNTSFSIKDGTNYVERWTGRGESVGNGSVRQTLTGLPTGRYRLTAAAQNIQEDSPSAKKTGAWIVGDNQRTVVGPRGQYSVTFTVVTGDAVIGFVAENAQGNWIACDNFRMEYIGPGQGEVEAEMASRIAAAEKLVDKWMNGAVKEQLTAAIAAAKEAQPAAYAETASALRVAVEAAETSIAAYTALQKAITAAEKVCATGNGNERATFQAVIDAAQAMYDSPESQNDAMEGQIKALEKATFAYRVSNGTGSVPKVTTVKRYARGAIEAFGRMTVSGVNSSQIMEQGFCWSTNPYPTVMDNRSTDYLECNGRLYRMSMEPATVYYIRAYAMTKTYAVGYGDIIKISTLPMGKVTYSYNNNDGGDFHYNKNTNALNEACWYWSNYTSIRGFHVSCEYNSWTETANCGYGGGMSIGPNTGQRTGTCMHEMNHGIGGGTIEIWGGNNESPLRTSVNGDWAGDRTNDVLRFWENRDDLVITAAYDAAHWGFRTLNDAYSDKNMWYNKYAFNGSHLEAGNWAGPQNWNDTQIAYIGNSLINQAMCEDGLVPVNYYSGGFCLPAYEFEQDDLKKYYIKSESADYGLYDSYLIEAKGGKVKWTSVSAGSVTQNDSAAWNITFDPATQYYMMRNVATGHYLTYSLGFKTVTRTSPVANDKFHLMRGRKDVKVGKVTARGYWIIHPENSSSPATMTAGTKGSVDTKSLDLYDRATQQRWIFLDADQVEAFEVGGANTYKDELQAYIKQIRKLQQTPHVEDVDGADDMLNNSLSTIEASVTTVNSVAGVQTLLADARTAGIDFLSSVSPTDVTKPFDLTFMVVNAALDSNEGWSDVGKINYSCCEFYERTFDFNQTVTGLPKGNFKLMAQAFQRPGSLTDSYNNFQDGKNDVTAVLYAGSKSKKICHIAEGAQSKRVHTDDKQVGSPAQYVPNTMASVAAYFKKNLYDNEVWVSTTRKNASLKIGLRGTISKTEYWSIFDNFRLYYYGSLTQDTVTPVEEIEVETPVTTLSTPVGVYNLKGILVRRGTNDTTGLPAGIYIAGGRKVVVK